MPINGSQLRGRRLRDARALPLPKRNVKQRENSARKVRPVRRRQKIKEAAARVCREKHSRRGKPAPGDDLPGQEQQTESGRQRPPGPKGLARAAFKFSPRNNNCDAAE